MSASMRDLRGAVLAARRRERRANLAYEKMWWLPAPSNRDVIVEAAHIALEAARAVVKQRHDRLMTEVKRRLVQRKLSRNQALAEATSALGAPFNPPKLKTKRGP